MMSLLSLFQREHNISAGDFPDINKMREHLPDYDFTKFNPIKPKLLDVVDGMLASDIGMQFDALKEKISSDSGCY